MIIFFIAYNYIILTCVKPVHKALKLRHHKHTGKLLSHKHTSYRVLFLLMLMPIGIMALVDQLNVAASDFTVNATVPAPMPEGVPVITTPQPNDTGQDAGTVMSGTCPIITPAVIIAVYDNGSLIGSTICNSDGTFLLPVALDYGTHTLIATIFTITGEKGTSSNEITFTRVYPQSPGIAVPSAGTSDQSGSDTSTSPELLGIIGVLSENPFVGFDTSGEASWRAKFVGGDPPYKVRIDWGDKTIDNHTVPDHEERLFTHRYKLANTYNIIVKVTDIKGRTVTYHTIAVAKFVPKLITYGNTTQSSPILGFLQKYMWHIYIITFFGLVFMWYLEHGHKAVKRATTKRKRATHGHH
jgi:hypothetical protein